MGQPVVHFELMAKDAGALQEFYRQLFDWKIDTSFPGYGLVDTQSQGGINGGIGQTQPEMPPYLTFYVQVPDLQSCLDRAEALRSRTIVPPTEIEGAGVTIAMFQDPQGNAIGLIKG